MIVYVKSQWILLLLQLFLRPLLAQQQPQRQLRCPDVQVILKYDIPYFNKLILDSVQLVSIFI